MDATQDFFVDVMLGRNLIGQADRHRGRFRPYLLHCLKNYLRERHRRGTARCRAPDRPLLALDQWADSRESGYQPPVQGMTPEDLFHRRWATAMLERVIDKLRSECRGPELEAHYAIFRDRFIRPALEQVEPVPVEELADRYGLTAKQVANRGETIRRRFRKLLLDEVRMTVADEAGAEDELQAVMASFR